MNIEDWIARARQGLLELGLDEVRNTGILPERGEKFFPVIGYPPLTMFGDMDEGPLSRISNRVLRIRFPLMCTFPFAQRAARLSLDHQNQKQVRRSRCVSRLSRPRNGFVQIEDGR